MHTYGWLITTSDRSLFVRTDAETEWARIDSAYKVIELVDKNDTSGDPDFADYRDVAEALYKANMAEIMQLKETLEEFVEVVEAITEVAIPSENIIENKAKILLIGEQCKKLLAAKE